MDVLSVLKNTNLGDSVAENERDKITNYFVKTEAWEELVDGNKDIIYGGKGTGKSALYLLLIKEASEIQKQGIHLIAGEEVAEDPVFRQLNDEAERRLNETEFRGLWKIYILTLIGNYIQENFSEIKELKQIVKLLQSEGLIPLKGLKRIFKVAISWIARTEPSLETPGGFKGKIVLREPTLDEEKVGKISVKGVLSKIDRILANKGIGIWVLFDRLDVAFTEPDVETPALRSLFRVYRDFAGFKSIKLKIFLRNDIWERITREKGFREQSHFTRIYTIKWDKDSLRHLVLSRFFENKAIEDYTGLTKEQVLGNPELQGFVFRRIFPKQVESGPKQRETFDWMLSRIQDGKQNRTPREVIQLIKSAREAQVRKEEVGGTGSRPKGHLISADALKLALNEVSEAKVLSIKSEYPELQKHIEAFEGRKTEHNAETIKKMFLKHGLPRNDDMKIIKRLVEIGFLQERKTGKVVYWVPFIFRPYLAMSQGASFDKTNKLR